MAVTRLYPFSTTNQAQMPPNAGTAASALGDENDTTHCSAQFSSTENTKSVWGVGPGAITQLPAGVGKVNGITFNVRADKDAGQFNVFAGEYPNTRVSGDVPLSPATLSSGLVSLWPTAADVNALGWIATLTFVAGPDGTIARVRHLSFDVNWDPAISGFKAFLFSLLPGMIGAGLTVTDLPGLALELARRRRTWLTAAEWAWAVREFSGRDPSKTRHRPGTRGAALPLGV